MDQGDRSFHDHFSSVAGRYAGFRPSYPAALFDYLATIVPTDSAVWECACGSGQATVDLAARFQKVFATDASPEQVGSAPARPNIQYSVALAEQSGLPSASVRLITVAQALHWFDFNRFFAEAKRVLMANGVLAAWAYGVNGVEGAEINQLVQDFYSNVVGPFWPPERKFVEDGYRTISFPFNEVAPPAFRMETRWTMEQLLGYFSTWSATNAFIKSTGRDPLPAFAAGLQRLWPDANSPRLITWPLSVRIGRVAPASYG
jgi:ubiquinone/menaquinone biosynthesis C-methylase UbiE